MTQRPQSQSIAWPEDDALTDDGEGPSVATAMSSWQEEAHWMSFRNAVQYFSALTIHEAPANESVDGSASSSYAAASAATIPPPVRQIGVQSSPALPSAVDSPDQGPSVLVEVGANSTFTNSTAGASSLAPTSTSHRSKVDVLSDSRSTTSKKSAARAKKSMASDLAETKMRLALAQAERDELEFALMMGGNSERSISGI